jgi:hypothetical protein
MGEIEKAIRNSELGLNPANDGNIIRVPIPALNEERRREMVRMLHKIRRRRAGSRSAMRGRRRTRRSSAAVGARAERGRGASRDGPDPEADGRVHRQDRPPPQGQGGGGHGGLSWTTLPDHSDLLQAIRLGGRVPAHVAVIMDGNGRWARARGLPRFRGHSAGMKSVRDVHRGRHRGRRRVPDAVHVLAGELEPAGAEVDALMRLLQRLRAAGARGAEGSRASRCTCYGDLDRLRRRRAAPSRRSSSTRAAAASCS